MARNGFFRKSYLLSSFAKPGFVIFLSVDMGLSMVSEYRRPLRAFYPLTPLRAPIDIELASLMSRVQARAIDKS